MEFLANKMPTQLVHQLRIKLSFILQHTNK